MTTNTQALAAMTPCGDCGMPCRPTDYHPMAACLMFKACHDSAQVTANLQAVRQHALASRLQEQEGQPALSDEQIDAIGIQLLKGGAYETICGSVPYGAELQPLLRATVHAALATLAAGSQAAQVPGWRPIETAPRGANGVAWFLLAWGSEGDQSTGVGMRIGEKFFAAGIFYRLGQEKTYEFREVEVQPTYWMPLPAAPLQPLAGGEAHD